MVPLLSGRNQDLSMLIWDFTSKSKLLSEPLKLISRCSRVSVQLFCSAAAADFSDRGKKKSYWTSFLLFNLSRWPVSSSSPCVAEITKILLTSDSCQENALLALPPLPFSPALFSITPILFCHVAITWKPASSPCPFGSFLWVCN